MPHDALRNSGLVRALADLLADLSDLVHKELRLARAELTEKVSAKLQASVWVIAASVLGFIAILLIVQGLVFAISSYGFALHWACLMVAAIVAALGAALFYHGRSLADEELLPTRTIRQVTRDIETAKEQLT